jgi:hypothetical protein
MVDARERGFGTIYGRVQEKMKYEDFIIQGCKLRNHEGETAE